MGKDYIDTIVHGVAMSGNDDSPVILLKDKKSEKIIAIPVGPFEASAVLLEIEGIRHRLPLTHDLLADFFRDHGFTLDETLVEGVPGGFFVSRIKYSKGPKSWIKEIRPSDAIALAVRLRACIKVSDIAASKPKRTATLDERASNTPARSNVLWLARPSKQVG